jgi:predicted ester cyclase
MSGSQGARISGKVGVRSSGTRRAIAILQIADGRVTEVRAQFDQLGMMRQRGVVA